MTNTKSEPALSPEDADDYLFYRVARLLPPFADFDLIKQALSRYRADLGYALTATDGEINDFMIELSRIESMRHGGVPDEFSEHVICVKCGPTCAPPNWPKVSLRMALTCPWCANDAGDHLH
ncbi:MAG: hypothetical protein EVA65_16420 [Oceanococcus sp.]|nr:MAG: hypothetical protein EVA65_16420 [Oceanococcus sp.]